MRKKFVVEFGRRGGAHTDNIIVNTELVARKIAANFVRAVASCPEKGAQECDWYMTLGVYRKSWQDSDHFAAISLLDGVMRGPAAAKLWKRNGDSQGFKAESYDQITH